MPIVAICGAGSGGQPYCPKCIKVYAYVACKLWKCAGWLSVLGIGADDLVDRNRSIRDYLLAIVIFASGAKVNLTFT